MNNIETISHYGNLSTWITKHDWRPSGKLVAKGFRKMELTSELVSSLFYLAWDVRHDPTAGKIPSNVIDAILHISYLMASKMDEKELKKIKVEARKKIMDDYFEIANPKLKHLLKND